MCFYTVLMDIMITAMILLQQKILADIPSSLRQT